jgi:hypothetical protein
MRGIRQFVLSHFDLFTLQGLQFGYAELGEFCFVVHDLIFDSNLFTCSLKCPVRREAYTNPFFRISMFSLCRGYNLGMQNSVSSASFFMILCLILIYLHAV